MALVCITTNISKAQYTLDTSGIGIFWQIADTLSVDQEPSQLLWDSFESHPGYQQIEISGRRISALKTVLPIVFTPSKERELNKLLAGKGSFHKYLATHLDQVKQRREELDTYLRAANLDGIVQKALTRSFSYLPKSESFKDANIPVYIMLFEDNGFGGQSIAIDLFHLMKSTLDESSDFLAHEFHHALRGLAKGIPTIPKEDDSLIRDVFERLTEEGIASMLDKQKYFEAEYLSEVQGRNDDKYHDASEFVSLVSEAKATLSRVDSFLIKASKDEIDQEEASREISRLLPWGGHVIGFYMARAIENQLGREDLLSVVNSPVKFMLLYSSASEKNSDLYRFTETSITFIESME